MSRSLGALFLMLAGSPAAVFAQNIPCRFDSSVLSFEGTPVAQARCLLRPNGIGGVLGVELGNLPYPLEELIGTKVRVRREAFERFLTSRSILPENIGGLLTRPLASLAGSDGGRETSLYFVIHDTSYPYLGDGEFPADFDSDPAWRGNDLSVWADQPVAHVFVNRLGQTLTTTPFEEPVRKGFGTKFARDTLKAERKGLQLHIELVQPRRREASDPNPKNDRIAPRPGFTAAQYEMLAILYLAASLRKGTWLIPGYHSAYDAGIKDAHDDPQNFELPKFGSAIAKLLKQIK